MFLALAQPQARRDKFHGLFTLSRSRRRSRCTSSHKRRTTVVAGSSSPTSYSLILRLVHGVYQVFALSDPGISRHGAVSRGREGAVHVGQGARVGKAREGVSRAVIRDIYTSHEHRLIIERAHLDSPDYTSLSWFTHRKWRARNRSRAADRTRKTPSPQALPDIVCRGGPSFDPISIFRPLSRPPSGPFRGRSSIFLQSNFIPPSVIVLESTYQLEN